MEIKIVSTTNNLDKTKSKYDKFWSTIFTDSDIKMLLTTLEQTKTNPSLAVEIDISEIKNISERRNEINERAKILNDGSIKAYGSAVKSLAKYLSSNGIKNVSLIIKEIDGNVVTYIKYLNDYVDNKVNENENENLAIAN